MGIKRFVWILIVLMSTSVFAVWRYNQTDWYIEIMEIDGSKQQLYEGHTYNIEVKHNTKSYYRIYFLDFHNMPIGYIDLGRTVAKNEVYQGSVTLVVDPGKCNFEVYGVWFYPSTTNYGAGNSWRLTDNGCAGWISPTIYYNLGVSVPEVGGIVSIGEEGIASYGSAYFEEIDENTVIELSAIPDEGYAFSHYYINQQIETSDSTLLTMNQDYVVEAYFYDLSSYAKIQLEWIHLPNGTWGDAADISWDYKIMEGEISNYGWVTGKDFTGDWFEMELPCKVYLEFNIDDPLFVHSITSIRVNGKAVTFEKVGQYEATVGFIFGEGFETQEFGLNAVAPSLFNYYSSGGTYIVTLITGNGGSDIPPSDPDKANVMPYGAVRDNAHDWIMPDGALFGYATYGEDGLVKSRSEQNIGYLDWERKEITMDLYSGKYYTVRRWDNKINFFTITEEKAVYLGTEMVGAVSVRPISYRGQMYDGLVSIYDRQFPMRNNKIYFYDIILEVVGPNMLPPGEEDDNFPADPDDYPEDQQYDEELTKWKSFIKDLFVMSQTQWEILLGELRSSLEGKFPFGLFYEANLLGNVDTEEQGLGFIDLSHWNLGTADLEDTPISDPVKEMSVNISRFLFWGFFAIWLLSFLQVRLVID